MATEFEKLQVLTAIMEGDRDKALNYMADSYKTQKDAEAKGIAFKETTEKAKGKKPAFLMDMTDEEDMADGGDDEEAEGEPPMKMPTGKKKKEANDEMDLSDVTLGELPVSGFAEIMSEILDNAVSTKETDLEARYKEVNSGVLTELSTTIKEIRKEVKTLKAAIDELNGHQPAGYRPSRDSTNIIEQFKNIGKEEQPEPDAIEKLLTFN
jgi:ribosomal protein S20